MHGPPIESPFGPFPNLSTFKLGEWCLSGGGEITLGKLWELAEIAQTPGFVEDIANVNWGRIFSRLGANKGELQDHQTEGWLDDEGWTATPISIPIFLDADAITEDYHVGTLYHRSIVSIVQQKIANSSDANMFHYDPHELLWQPDPSTPPVHVYS